MFFKKKLGHYTTSALYSLLAGVSLHSYGLSSEIYCTNSENYLDQKKLSTIDNFHLESLFPTQVNLSGKTIEFKTIDNQHLEIFEVILPRHYRELELKDGFVKNFLNEIESKLIITTEESISLKRHINSLKNQTLIENNTINLFLDQLIKEINNNFNSYKENFPDVKQNFNYTLQAIRSEIKNPNSKINKFIIEFKQNHSIDTEQLDNYINYLLSEFEIPNSHLLNLFRHLIEKENTTSKKPVYFNDILIKQLNTPNSKLLNHLNYVKNLLPLSKQQKTKIRAKIKQELANSNSQLNLHLEVIRESLFNSYIIHNNILDEYLAANSRTNYSNTEEQNYYEIETKKLSDVCTQLANACIQKFGTNFSTINAHSFNYNKNLETQWLPIKINNYVCRSIDLKNTINLKIPIKDIIDNFISELIFENLFNLRFNNESLHTNLRERGLPARNKNKGSTDNTNTCSLKSLPNSSFDPKTEPAATEDDGWSVAYRKSPIPERFIYKALEIADQLKTRNRNILQQGKVFKNHEKRLPNGGYYYEFDVVCEEQRGRRDAKRLVIDINSLKWWYTKDHYQTFIFDSQKDNDIIQRVLKGAKQ